MVCCGQPIVVKGAWHHANQHRSGRKSYDSTIFSIVVYPSQVSNQSQMFLQKHPHDTHHHDGLGSSPPVMADGPIYHCRLVHWITMDGCVRFQFI